MKYPYEEFCCCVKCGSDIREKDSASYTCTNRDCQKSYFFEQGILNLIPAYTEKQRRYRENYENIARNFFATDKYIKNNVRYKHEELLKFLGKIRPDAKILDVGSGNGILLSQINAEFKVALDISITHLSKITPNENTAMLLGDAEKMPFKSGFFDIIIIADILEHVLNPKALVQCIRYAASPATKIFVQVPWEGDLTSHINGPWEFAHLRSFNSYRIHALWSAFQFKKEKKFYPQLTMPFIFTLDGKLPYFVFKRFMKWYFSSKDVVRKDAVWRQKKRQELPKHTWWLSWFYKPVFRIFELRLREGYCFRRWEDLFFEGEEKS